MAGLKDHELKEIVYELRGITKDIDIQFEDMLFHDKINFDKYDEMHNQLNGVLDLLVMYLRVINSMQT